MAGGNRAEAEVAGGEVELLVVERVVGDVHLAVDAGDMVGRGAGGIEHCDGVVIEAWGAALKEAGDESDVFLANDRSETSCAGTGDGLGQGEERVVLALAEVLRAEEFRQANDLRAGAGRLADQIGGVVEVLRDGGRAGHLDEGYAGGWR